MPQSSSSIANLEQTTFRNIQVGSLQSLNKKQENKHTGSQAFSCCCLRVTTHRKRLQEANHCQNLALKPQKAPEQQTNSTEVTGLSVSLSHHQLNLMSVNHNTQVRHVSSSPPNRKRLICMCAEEIHINQLFDKKIIYCSLIANRYTFVFCIIDI